LDITSNSVLDGKPDTAVAPLNKALTVITHRSDTYLPLANLYLE